MRVVSLGSGSSGNALLVEAGPQRRTKLLIDAGLSAQLIISRLRTVGVQPTQLQGVLVTHEHSDHVQGLPILMKRFSLPTFADIRTHTAIQKSIGSGVWRTDSGTLVPTVHDEYIKTAAVSSADPLLLQVQEHTENEQLAVRKSVAMLPEIAAPLVINLPVGTQRVIGDIEVISFPISHDAVAPCGYLLSAGGCRICLVTDSGEVTPAMLDAMRLADLLILEANHERQRLVRGPYPYHLKQRILSPSGHLSNEQAAAAVLNTWRADSLRWLWLGHLSRTNNTPRLALESMRASLHTANANLAHIHISVLPPALGPIWDSTQLWHSSSLWQMDLY